MNVLRSPILTAPSSSLTKSTTTANNSIRKAEDDYAKIFNNCKRSSLFATDTTTINLEDKEDMQILNASIQAEKDLIVIQIKSDLQQIDPNRSLAIHEVLDLYYSDPLVKEYADTI